MEECNLGTSLFSSLLDCPFTHFQFTRGSYMSAHVLLNLLNELSKRDKM